MADDTPRCPYHIDHDTRIKNLESEQKDMKAHLSSPQITVALIGLIGIFLTAITSFAGVVFAPIVRAWLGV